MEKQNKNKEFKEVSLTDLLDKEDLKIVFKLIKKNDWDTLRAYLHSIEDKLIQKGVLPDYLFYALQAKIK
jgi:hypothetical protein